MTILIDVGQTEKGYESTVTNEEGASMYQICALGYFAKVI